MRQKENLPNAEVICETRKTRGKKVYIDAKIEHTATRGVRHGIGRAA